MRVREVRLADFRCHHQLSVRLGSEVTVLVGPNGAGKTSVLEAVHFALQGSSPRTSQNREVIRWGAPAFRAEVDLEDVDGRVVKAAFGYSATGERRVTAGGAALSDLSRWEESCPIRFFMPSDARIVSGGPRHRRRVLDRLATTMDPAYAGEAAAYEEALTQRNTLLRRGVVGPDHAPWETLLSRLGLRLASRRMDALRDLFPRYTEMHALLTPPPAQQAGLVYRTNVVDLDEDSYRGLLVEQRESDRQRTYTNLGPHRDEVRFTLGGRDLREYGSQGERRTALLALVLAERAWAEGFGGRKRVLLLDDVMGELDEARRRTLVGLLGSGGQVMITTTDLHYFTSEELATMMVVELPSGDGSG